jgi:hypothetical protein
MKVGVGLAVSANDLNPFQIEQKDHYNGQKQRREVEVCQKSQKGRQPPAFIIPPAI